VALPRSVHPAFETVGQTGVEARPSVCVLRDNHTREFSTMRETGMARDSTRDWASAGLETLEGLASYLIRVGRLLAKAFAVGVCDRLHADERRFRATVQHSTASLIGIRRAPHLPGRSSKQPGIV
jgi:hypothetical protein